MPSAGSHSVHFPILESVYNIRILESRLLTIQTGILHYHGNEGSGGSRTHTGPPSTAPWGHGGEVSPDGRAGSRRHECPRTMVMTAGSAQMDSLEVASNHLSYHLIFNSKKYR